jgi:hypothetical protein
LVAGGDPAGFDAERIQVQADALVAKRRELVARLRPDLAAEPGFRAAFAAWARTRPPAGARADATAFAAATGPRPRIGRVDPPSTARHRNGIPDPIRRPLHRASPADKVDRPSASHPSGRRTDPSDDPPELLDA